MTEKEIQHGARPSHKYQPRIESGEELPYLHRQIHKWAKRAHKDPLNYELYYEAFASKRACSAFEMSMEENGEENDASEPQAGDGNVERKT
ncbi:hypothetical protein L484_003131 [Morus notabilis]|uniref:Uncharacterized protein n=1 Tax=Morus notabilis TaxID=981085 RepID=W9QIB2_9ROSA|nr:hypothetical protein L484_003131 [Morus notabilis]